VREDDSDPEAPDGGADEAHEASPPASAQPEEIDVTAHAWATLTTFLQQDDWNARELPDVFAYRMSFLGRHGQLVCHAEIDPAHSLLLVYVLAPIRVPEPARAAAMEFFTRANYGLRIGNFELDLGDGEIRFKCTVAYDGTLLDLALVRNALYAGVRTTDAYLPGLLGMLYGNLSPEAAIRGIEENEED
jgi:hypothetical protein